MTEPMEPMEPHHDDLVEQAMILLGLEPLPADAEKQLNALYKKATAEDKRCCFPHLYSGLFLLQNSTDP